MDDLRGMWCGKFIMWYMYWYTETGPSLVDPHLTFVEGMVTQMDEDMGDSPDYS